MSRICPAGWFYLTTKIEGANEHDVVYTYACSVACRDRMWCEGPGPEISPIIFMPAVSAGALPPPLKERADIDVRAELRRAPCRLLIADEGPDLCAVHGLPYLVCREERVSTLPSPSQPHTRLDGTRSDESPRLDLDALAMDPHLGKGDPAVDPDANRVTFVDVLYGTNDPNPDTAIFIKSIVHKDRVLAAVLLVRVKSPVYDHDVAEFARGNTDVVILPHVDQRRSGEECAWRARR